jgi:hypothetical protein
MSASVKLAAANGFSFCGGEIAEVTEIFVFF